MSIKSGFLKAKMWKESRCLTFLGKCLLLWEVYTRPITVVMWSVPWRRGIKWPWRQHKTLLYWKDQVVHTVSLDTNRCFHHWGICIKKLIFQISCLLHHNIMCQGHEVTSQKRAVSNANSMLASHCWTCVREYIWPEFDVLKLHWRVFGEILLVTAFCHVGLFCTV